MSSAQNHREMDDLIQKYLDGEISDAESETLQAWLSRSDDNLDIFIEQIKRHSALSETARGIMLGRDMERSSVADQGSGRVVPGRFRVARLPLLAAAALLLIAVGVWMLFPSEEKNDRGLAATGRGQTMALRFDGEDTLVEMAENTRLKVLDASVVADAVPNVEIVKIGETKVIQLDAGSINVSVAKQAQGKSFVVKTAQAEIRVVGTKFQVAVGVDRKKTRVDVQEGVVKVGSIADGATVALTGGKWAVFEDGKPMLTEKIWSPADREYLLPEEFGVNIGKSFSPNSFTYDGKLWWVAGATNQVVYAVDLEERKIKDRIDLSAHCVSVSALAWDRETLWAVVRADERSNNQALLKITRAGEMIDVKTNQNLGPCNVLASGGGYVWLGSWIWNGEYVDKLNIMRLDPESGRVLKSIAVSTKLFKAGLQSSLLWLDDGLWLVTEEGRRMLRVDPDTGNPLIDASLFWSGNGAVKMAGAGAKGFWGINHPSGGRVILFEKTSAAVDK